MAVSVLCLFLAMAWVGLWYVIVVFPGQTMALAYDNIYLSYANVKLDLLLYYWQIVLTWFLKTFLKSKSF